MPFLVLVKCPPDPPTGFVVGRPFELRGPTQVIGRDERRCQFVVDHHTISREHARFSVRDGAYIIEDLKSRNHTFVNNRKVNSPTPIRPGDNVRFCEFEFHLSETDDEGGGSTTVEVFQDEDSDDAFLRSASNERLVALYNISNALARPLSIDRLVDLIADNLFAYFKQADRCFVLLLDENGEPEPKAVRTRATAAHRSVLFSRTVVRKALEAGQGYLREDVLKDTSLDSVASVAESRIRSVMCVPLKPPEGKALGAIQIDTQEHRRGFNSDDLNFLAIVANMAAVAVERARLHETLLQMERERQETAFATEVQRGFLPQRVPHIAGYEFFARYMPAEAVGGDYYDFIALPGGRVAVVLGDVTGHGVAAAMLVAKLSSEVRFCLPGEPDLAKGLTRLNDQMILCGLGGETGRFITLVAFVLDPVAHQVTVVNAGHEPAKLYSTVEGTLRDVVSIADSGIALGVVPGTECHYKTVTFSLERGDTISIYTDGVIEAMNEREELLGREAVEKLIFPPIAAAVETKDEIEAAKFLGLRGDDSRPVHTGQRILEGVYRHANGHPQFDDIALVCFGRLGLGVDEAAEISSHPPTTKHLTRPRLPGAR